MHCRPFYFMVMTWLACAGFEGQCRSATRVEGEPHSEQFRIRRWSVDEGLPQSRIVCLKQTRDGYLWIGTFSGLARFDGVRFTPFDTHNTPELLSDAINGLAEDTEG